MIVDFHTHFYPQKLAARVMTQLQGTSGIRAVTDGTAEDTRQKLLTWGVDRCVFLPVAATLHFAKSNEFAAELADDFFIPFGTLHPACPDPEAEVEHIAELGLRGIKLHPQYQQVAIDDLRYVRIIRRAAQLRLPVIFHAGFDPGLPAPYLAEPEAIARLLDQVEDIDGLVLIAAHLGGYQRYDAVERFLVGRNIWFDTALVAGEIAAEQFRRIIERHGAARILLGSDCPWHSSAAAIEGLHALALPAEDEAAILGGNAVSLLSL